MKDAYGVHHLIWTPQINTIKVSERQTKTQLIFSALLYASLFFFSVEYLLSGLTALHWDLSDLEGKRQVQTQRRRLISVDDWFHTKISRKPSSDYRGLPINFFLLFSALFPSLLFLILLLFFPKLSDAARWIVLSVRGLVGDLATHVAKVMVNKGAAAG